MSYQKDVQSNLCTTATLGTRKTWPLCRGLYEKDQWLVGFRLAVRAADWPLLTGGRYSEVVVRTGLTVYDTKRVSRLLSHRPSRYNIKECVQPKMSLNSEFLIWKEKGKREGGGWPGRSAGRHIQGKVRFVRDRDRDIETKTNRDKLTIEVPSKLGSTTSFN
jgi:hypothetical protein